MEKLSISTVELMCQTEERELNKYAFNELLHFKVLEEQIRMPLLKLFNEIFGKSIYYINDEVVDTCRVMGLRLRTVNDTIFSFTSIIPNDYDYEIITDSCWSFRISDLGVLWFIAYEEAAKNGCVL